MAITASFPRSDLDLLTDEALADPYPLYARLRELGPVVWLETFGTFAATQDEEARVVLSDPATFSSAQGIAMSVASNTSMAGALMIATDPPLHQDLREVFRRPLRPGALATLSRQIGEQADQLVAGLVERDDWFDAVEDLACYLPLTIVSYLVGIPEQGRERLLEWGTAFFDFSGGDTPRAERAAPLVGQMLAWAAENVRPGLLSADGWAQQLFDAGDRGELPEEWVPRLALDYMLPSLDTTINATSAAVMLLAQHPDQWELLRREPRRIPSAISEAIRMQTPLPIMSRVTTRDVELAGVVIPEGSRVAALLASANRDEKRWKDADTFDITRPDAARHLGFGTGEHNCVGQGLAQLEMQSILQAMVGRVGRIEIGEPEPLLNQGVHGLSRLPMRFHRPA